jgi:hypothetical protein
MGLSCHWNPNYSIIIGFDIHISVGFLKVSQQKKPSVARADSDLLTKVW